MQKLGKLLLRGDIVEVQVVGVLLQDALTHRLLLDLTQPFAVLADYAQILVRPPV